MELEFIGAARTVTGSMHLLHVGGKKILLDCGIYHGRRDESMKINSTFPFDPTTIDAVVLSHAHIDHSGNLPTLVKYGYRGPIHCTEATKSLCEVMLLDSAFIQEKDAEYIGKRRARESGRPPVLAFIDHIDYQFGNMHDVAGIAKVAHQYDIPVLYNGAYTVGILPVDGKAFGVDFVVGSGHKSMAAPAPSGVLAATAEREKEVFRTTAITGDVTNRKFGIKEPEMMGCTLMGVTLVGMMASFPHVKERVKHFDRELANHKIVMDALLSIEGTKCLSEYPRKHTMTRIDTLGSFDTVAESHKKRGYYLQSALEERGITGVIPGATKVWKFNTYGMTTKQAEHLGRSFVEIACENGIAVKG